LALIAKHLHLDPYSTWHVGRREPLPPHPQPRLYRAFLGACAEWLENREIELAIESGAGGIARMLFGEPKGQKKRKRRRRGGRPGTRRG
jgi:hypothetical protein